MLRKTREREGQTMQMRMVLLALITLLSTSSARSEVGIYFSANMMLDYCIDKSDAKTAQQFINLNFCRGYVAAIGANSQCGQTQDPDYEHKIPAGVTVDQLVLIFRKYMHDHPEKLNIDGTFIAAEALAKAFPCK